MWQKKITTMIVVLFGLMLVSSALAANQTAKYVFVFIGDGMGIAQRNTAELYLASQKKLSRPEEAKLVMNTFPAQGMNTTYDLSSVIPASASTATAIAPGNKTKSGVIGMDADGKISYQSISERAAAKGWKIGIISTVSLDHATPAAFYAHVPKRSQMYEICVQLANSGFDYFAGGQMAVPKDPKDPAKANALDILKQKGYQIAVGRSEFDAIRPTGQKVYAVNQLVDGDAAMYYTLDQQLAEGNGKHITLAEFVSKGIELLNNPKGFLMAVEAGKIDWACHANDAAASIHDTLAFDEAIAEAVKFYNRYPNDTLIVVTGDHETGGMTVGFAGTRYSSFVDKIERQKMSYIEFGKKLDEFKKTHHPKTARFEDILPLIEANFGLFVMPAAERAQLEKAIKAGKSPTATSAEKAAAKDATDRLLYGLALNDLELQALKQAFQESMAGKETRAKDEYTYLLYGGYEPLAVKLTTILNNKAGIAWTSYSHTGVPVMTSALGIGAEQFNGYYDQTDIRTKMIRITGL